MVASLRGHPVFALLAAVACIATANLALARVERIRTARTPYRITEPGLYVLETNLAVSNPTTHAIEVQSNDVTIDLNGFTISGPGSGSGDGIHGIGRTNVRVLNGTIRAMGGKAIDLGDYARIQGVTATHNGQGIIGGATGTFVGDCIAAFNAGSGIAVGTVAIVKDSIAYENGIIGIAASDSTVVTQSVVVGNNVGGYDLGDGALLNNSIANGNVAAGVQFFDGSGAVLGSVFRGNTGRGIAGFDAFAYGQNVLVGNNGGGSNPQVATTGLQLEPNQCGVDLTCP